MLKSARVLRKQQTPEEKRLWLLIKDKQLGYKFRRQMKIDNYIVDFCCFEKRLIVELDGNLHRNISAKIKDQKREKYLESEGFKVIRFWNSELTRERNVINKIKQYLNTPHLSDYAKASSDVFSRKGRRKMEK